MIAHQKLPLLIARMPAPRGTTPGNAVAGGGRSNSTTNTSNGAVDGDNNATLLSYIRACLVNRFNATRIQLLALRLAAVRLMSYILTRFGSEGITHPITLPYFEIMVMLMTAMIIGVLYLTGLHATSPRDNDEALIGRLVFSLANELDWMDSERKAIVRGETGFVTFI
jgi:hypothetical protein